MAKTLTPDEVFNSAPPLNGGNAFSTNELIKAIDQNIRTGNENLLDIQAVSGSIISEFSSKAINDTYNFWWLLNFMTDYFANLVQFNFKDSWLQKQVIQSIKIGVMFGDSGLHKPSDCDKWIGMFVSKYHCDKYGIPYECDGTPTNQLSMTNLSPMDTSPAFKSNNQIISNMKIDEDIVLFNPWSFSIGGIVRWRPFLNQMVDILKQLRTYGYGLTKKLAYNIHDKSAIADEVKLFMDPDVPVLVNIGTSGGLINNKFSGIDFGQGNNTLQFIEYVKYFFDIYYSLLGRRFNNDKKQERNIAGEVDATQEQFDVLQHEIVTNIKNYLEDIKKKTGIDYEVVNDIEQQEQEQYQEQEEGFNNNDI